MSVAPLPKWRAELAKVSRRLHANGWVANHDGKDVGGPEVAVDTVSARPKTLVYLVGSREAALALDPWFVPVDSAIVGIVDQVNV